MPEEIACDILAFKISLALAFTSLLIIPVLIKPVNGLYDIAELESLRAYCYLHADRAAKGENVVNDLIKTGLANSTYNDWSCSKISETLQAEQNAESERQAAEARADLKFTEDCRDGNMAPSGWWACWDAGKTIGDSAGECDYNRPSDPLSAKEWTECDNRDRKYGEGKYAQTDEDKDKDSKDSDK